MKPSEVATALQVAIEVNRPVFIWGSPGIGKSYLVRQVADKLFGNGSDVSHVFAPRSYLRDIRTVLLDPVDLRGLPVPNKAESIVQWMIPEFFPRDGKGILFLDELNAAPPLVQAACYQLILDRRLGEYVLPDGWAIVAAGNFETDRAVTNRMPSPLANRFIHLEMETNLDDWVAWALDHDIMPEIIGGIRFRPGLLHDFDPKKNPKAFPTPRSWEISSDIVKVVLPDFSMALAMLSGIVGEGPATEMVSFFKICNELPSLDDIKKDPENYPVPESPAIRFALTGALARATDVKSIKTISKFTSRLPEEFNILWMKDALHFCPDVGETSIFIKWAEKNHNVII